MSNYFSMHTLHVILPLLFAVIGFASAAHAEGEAEITFRVVIDGVIAIDHALSVAPCAATASSTPTISAFCAIEASGLPHSWRFFGKDAFLNDLAGRANNEGGNNTYWLYFKNNEFGQRSMNTEALAVGDELLLSYNANPLRIEPFAANPPASATTTISVSQFGFDAAFNPVWSPAEGAVAHVSSGEELLTDATGMAEWFVATASPVSLHATKTGFADSSSIAVAPSAPIPSPPPPPSPPPATRTLRLVAAATSTVFFDGDVVFPACAPRPGDAETFALYCVLAASDGSPEWSWFGDNAFLNALFGEVNNAGGNNIYWLYFKNDELGASAMNVEEIADGDRIALAYGVMPLRLQAATTTPTVGENLAVDVRAFSFDASFNPQWLPAEGVTLFRDGNPEFAVGTTSVAVPILSTTPFTLHAEKSGWMTSAALTIYPAVQAATSSPDDGGNGGSGGGGGGGGGGSQSSSANLDIEKLLGFLDAHQRTDGSFGSDLYSDWAAVAYGATAGHATARDRLKTFLATDPLDGALLTDNERRAMALAALGVDPARGGQENYIQKIITAFDGSQFGDPTLYNDDIFAIIILSRAGYAGDEMLVRAGHFVVTTQKGNGGSNASVGAGWDGPDITAAAIQALAALGSSAEFATSLASARAYLETTQGTDGGWGSSFATSWVMQAFKAASVDPRSVVKNGKHGYDALALLQQSDGGMEDVATPLDTRVWATAYAVSAATEKTWRDILASFSRATETASAFSGGGGGSTTASETATTTPAVSTDVAGAATSTATGAASPDESPMPDTPAGESKEFSPPPLAIRTPSSSHAGGNTEENAEAVSAMEGAPAAQGSNPESDASSASGDRAAGALFAEPSILWAGAGVFMLIALGLWFWKPTVS